MSKGSSLSHEVANTLRRDIIAGVFEPGTWLKTEELAERYEVSANPVREALWRLQGEGFVVANPNQGARVRAVDDDFVRNIFEIREALEPMIVRRFCERATKSDIARLRDSCRGFPADRRAQDRRLRPARCRQPGLPRDHHRRGSEPAGARGDGAVCSAHQCDPCPATDVAIAGPGAHCPSRRDGEGDRVRRRRRSGTDRRDPHPCPQAKTCWPRCGRCGPAAHEAPVSPRQPRTGESQPDPREPDDLRSSSP